MRFEDDGEYFSVIASYSASENAYPMYAKKIKIHKNTEPTKKSGRSGAIDGEVIGLAGFSDVRRDFVARSFKSAEN